MNDPTNMVRAALNLVTKSLLIPEDEEAAAKAVIQTMLDAGWVPPEVIAANIVEQGGTVLIPDNALLYDYDIQQARSVDPPGWLIRARQR